MEYYTYSQQPECDWCYKTPYTPRSPRQAPYNYDDHYVWRDFDKNDMPKGIAVEYSDRLSQRDRAKYEAARKFAGSGWDEQMTRKQAEDFVAHYFDGEYKCIGFAKSCNQATGYGIGVFFMQTT